MNKQNQDRADKVAHVYKKSRKVRIADEVLKRAVIFRYGPLRRRVPGFPCKPGRR